MPHVQATAHVDGVTQTRSSAGQYNGWCQQGGLEVLERARFAGEGAARRGARRSSWRWRRPARAARWTCC